MRVSRPRVSRSAMCDCRSSRGSLPRALSLAAAAISSIIPPLVAGANTAWIASASHLVQRVEPPHLVEDRGRHVGNLLDQLLQLLAAERAEVELLRVEVGDELGVL